MDIAMTIIIYIVNLMTFIIYIYRKYKTKKYVLSVSNLYIFQYAVMQFLIPLFTFTPIAWVKLLGDSAYASAYIYYPYLLKSIAVNAIGFIAFILAMSHKESSKRKASKIEKTIRLVSHNISWQLIMVEFYACVLIWLFITVFYAGGLGFNGTSNLSSETGGILYYVNTIVQQVIIMVTFAEIFMLINSGRKKHGMITFIIGAAVCLLTGRRQIIIMDIAFTFVVYYLYKKNKRRTSKKILFKALKYVIPLIALGLIIQNIRGGVSSTFSLLEDFIYGNTFCDVRDGGFILYGYSKKYGSAILYGKTYLAGLLSFIPSSISAFRAKWNWGAFSTNTLFGWQNHPGFRGGIGMEGYLNFGYFGAIIFPALAGCVFGSLEKYFKQNVLSVEKRCITHKEAVTIYFFINLARELICSSGFFFIYIMAAFVAVNVLIGSVLRRNRRNQICYTKIY